VQTYTCTRRDRNFSQQRFYTFRSCTSCSLFFDLLFSTTPKFPLPSPRCFSSRSIQRTFFSLISFEACNSSFSVNYYGKEITLSIYRGQLALNGIKYTEIPKALDSTIRLLSKGDSSMKQISFYSSLKIVETTDKQASIIECIEQQLLQMRQNSFGTVQIF
jgi:hypothetical protein